MKKFSLNQDEYNFLIDNINAICEVYSKLDNVDGIIINNYRSYDNSNNMFIPTIEITIISHRYITDKIIRMFYNSKLNFYEENEYSFDDISDIIKDNLKVNLYISKSYEDGYKNNDTLPMVKLYNSYILFDRRGYYTNLKKKFVNSNVDYNDLSDLIKIDICDYKKKNRNLI